MAGYPIDPPVLFLAGCLLIGLVVLRHRHRRGTMALKAAPPLPAALPPPSDASPARDRWEVEMLDLARNLTAQLTTRTAVVEQLVQEADQRAQQLRVLLHESKTARPRAFQGGHLQRDNEETMASEEERPVARPSEGHLPLDRQVAIYALCDAGYTSAAIARRLEVPVGDVELMLSLRGAT